MSDLNTLPEGFGVADPDFMKTAHAEAKRERVNKGDVLFLKQGITHVTVLPPHENSPAWFREYKEHGLNPNDKFETFTCPSVNDDPCPVCERGEELYTTKTEEARALAKRYYPKKAYLYNVYVHSCPDGKTLADGIMVMKGGQKVHKQLMSLDHDNAGGWGDITNITDAVEVRIERSGKGRLDTNYNVTPHPKRSNILLKLEAAGFKISKPTDLNTVYPPRSYEDLREALATDEPKE